MFYEDLSKYEYFFSDNSGMIQNVGWLEGDKEFTMGDVSLEFIQKLKSLFLKVNNNANEANLVRGLSHCCNLCCENGVAVNLNGESKTLGSSEIWIPSVNGEVVFASPSMIIHYIEIHGYRPPRVFIDAVLDFDITSSFNAKNIIVERLFGPKGLEYGLK